MPASQTWRRPHGRTNPSTKTRAATSRSKPLALRIERDQLQVLGCSVRSPASSFAATELRLRAGFPYKERNGLGLSWFEADDQGGGEGQDGEVDGIAVARR